MQITEILLTSTDPAGAAHRYGELLEVPVDANGDRATVVIGSSRLVLTAGPTGPGVHHLAFTVPGCAFESAVQRLTDRAPLLAAEGRTRFEGPPHWNSLSVYFPGPDAAVLEYIWRRNLPDDELAAQAVPGSAAASISEIGVASQNLTALRQQLAQQCGLAAFGSPLPDFAPTGDEHGLLICVTAQRPWAPEGRQPAHGGPLRIAMSTSRGPATLDLDIQLEPRVTLAS